MREPRDRAGVPRRGVLRALALAPAALAGCAAGRGERSAGTSAPSEDGGEAAPTQAAPRGAGAAAVEAVRAFRLAPDAEPADVFRAAAARPGEPR
jgi:hypothetical protein